LASTINVNIDIEPKQCVFCGLCEILCPFNAIKLYVDDKPYISTLKAGVLPQILRMVEFDLETCRRVNMLCEHLCADACPTNIIYFDGFSIQITDAADCAACGWCEAVCHSAIKVEKPFQGMIKINNDKCPEECRNCLYACPVNAIYLDEDGKVNVLEEFCILCGACKNHCPEPNLITISITHINAGQTNNWKTLKDRLTRYMPQQNKNIIKTPDTQWPRTTKVNNKEKIRIERKIYLRKYILELDGSICRKCMMCYLACPKEAINITRIENNKSIDSHI